MVRSFKPRLILIADELARVSSYDGGNVEKWIKIEGSAKLLASAKRVIGKHKAVLEYSEGDKKDFIVFYFKTQYQLEPILKEVKRWIHEQGYSIEEHSLD